MIYGIGTDIVSVQRIGQLLSRHPERSAAHLLHPAEQLEMQSAPAADRFVAKRFAAKEATIKVLRLSPEQALPWSDIEIRRDGRGAPQLFLKGRASALARQAAEIGRRQAEVATAVTKGDLLIVPENTPHQVIPSGGPIVLMTMHVPRPAPANWP